ncbi:MAG: hypothetical protein IJO97_00330 [Lachnospiraceae bacterium]|nr:hypothetical protein [Lachnospiraceae bacterium]
MKQVSSFISSFSKYKKCFLMVVFTFVFCVIIERVLCFFLVSDVLGNGSSWERALFHEFYEQEEIDNLFLGSSHVFYNVIPEQLDEINGEKNFNLTTGVQPYNGSYYLLKEADRKFDLSHVYLEMYYAVPVYHADYNELSVLTRNWDILYQMPFSYNKFAYMCEMSDKEYYSMTFFETRRFADDIFDLESIKNNVTIKTGENYKQHRFVSYDNGEQEFYARKGYFYTEAEYEGDVFGTSTGGFVPFEENPIGDMPEQYLRKIIEYCQKNDIEITLFTSPMPDYGLFGMGNYDVYVEKVNEIAGEYGISYYDFNLCNTEYLELLDTSYFCDGEHMNVAGAEKFTSVLGTVMQAEKNSALPEDMFYETYQEKIAAIGNRILGLQYYVVNDSEKIAQIEKELDDFDAEKERLYAMHLISTGEVQTEYRISKIPEGQKEKTVMQDWSEQIYFAVPKEENGTIYIEIKIGNEIKTISPIYYSKME